jgi:hypothetical protein
LLDQPLHRSRSEHGIGERSTGRQLAEARIGCLPPGESLPEPWFARRHTYRPSDRLSPPGWRTDHSPNDRSRRALRWGPKGMAGMLGGKPAASQSPSISPTSTCAVGAAAALGREQVASPCAGRPSIERTHPAQS